METIWHCDATTMDVANEWLACCNRNGIPREDALMLASLAEEDDRRSKESFEILCDKYGVGSDDRNMLVGTVKVLAVMLKEGTKGSKQQEGTEMGYHPGMTRGEVLDEWIDACKRMHVPRYVQHRLIGLAGMDTLEAQVAQAEREQLFDGLSIGDEDRNVLIAATRIIVG